MKAFSIQQPWAYLICKGYKDIENRCWPTRFRGRVYVHAGKTIDVESLMHMEDFPENYDLPPADIGELGHIISNLRGVIIGEVDIVDCKFRFGEENDNLYSRWHIPGQYGFVLANPKLYDKPIPCKGKLGFFEPEIERMLE